MFTWLRGGEDMSEYVTREEWEADKRRKVSGYVAMDVLWEIKGECERSIERQLALLDEADATKRRALIAEEIKAQHRQLERAYRLLHMKGAD